MNGDMNKMMTKWIGDYWGFDLTGKTNGLVPYPIFVEIEPPYEMVDSDVIPVRSVFMGYSDEGDEVWTVNPVAV